MKVRIRVLAPLLCLHAATALAQFETTQVSAPGQPPFLMTKLGWQFEDLSPTVPGVSYNIYRRLPADGFRCLVQNLTAPSWSGDPQGPTAAVWWYTVNADDAWGENLHGNEVAIVEPCPCSGNPAMPGDVPIILQTVATGFTNPVHVAQPPGDRSRLYVVEQAGTIEVIRRGVRQPTPFLDITTRVLDSGGEQGLLSIAFHPGFQTNRKFYLYYTATGGGAAGQTIVAEYIATDLDVLGVNPPERIVYTAPQPFSNHNGGQLAFGPIDGYLYIGLGDGGSANDPGDRAQNLLEPMGKIMRIDVDGAPPYAIPPDNPFLGDPNALDEIWAYGLRNPWRFSFDLLNSDLYIGDVGQNCFEEVDATPYLTSRGANYGWRPLEGDLCRGTGCASGITCGASCPAAPSCAVYQPPVVVYDRTNGSSVTGGHVYRGCRMPGHAGRYFYSDFNMSWLRSFVYAGGLATDRRTHTPTASQVSSYGQDNQGEVYLVRRGAGSVLKIVPQ